MAKYEVHLVNGNIIHGIECDRVIQRADGIYFIDKDNNKIAVFRPTQVKYYKTVEE